MVSRGRINTRSTMLISAACHKGIQSHTNLFLRHTHKAQNFEKNMATSLGTHGFDEFPDCNCLWWGWASVRTSAFLCSLRISFVHNVCVYYARCSCVFLFFCVAPPTAEKRIHIKSSRSSCVSPSSVSSTSDCLRFQLLGLAWSSEDLFHTQSTGTRQDTGGQDKSSLKEVVETSAHGGICEQSLLGNTTLQLFCPSPGKHFNPPPENNNIKKIHKLVFSYLDKWWIMYRSKTVAPRRRPEDRAGGSRD